MKKLFIILVSIVSTLNLKAQTTANDVNAPVIKFDTETFDFGEIPQGTPASHNFVFTNTGKTPVIIKDAQNGCACMTETWSSEPVAPGKTGTITGTYTAAMTGAFTKSITVHSNASEPTKILFIKGTVVAK